MKKWSLLVVLTIALCGIPLYAQHGHSGGGMGGGGFHGSSHGGSPDWTHGNSSTTTHNPGSSAHDTSAGGPKTASQQLSHNTKLASKLQGLLPAGTNVQQASQGFKNLGQFVAAVHVSHNLGIPFEQLKAKMTSSSPESMGKAIQALKPAADSKTETKKANKQAKDDMNSKES